MSGARLATGGRWPVAVALGVGLWLALARCGPEPVDPLLPDAGSVAGPDAAASGCPADYTPCGDDCCGQGYTCNEARATCEVNSCKRQCQGRSCGPDGCGGLCGICSPGTACDLTRGGCFLCTGSCANKQCGDDGCGRSCGTCPGSYCQTGFQCAAVLGADAAVAGPDAAQPGLDAGKPGLDAGPSGRDAGPAGRDASQPGPDAGHPGLDASQPGPDAGSRLVRVLFDNTKAEQAGNADWVIDDSGRFPSPPNPTVETDWTGGCSAWGVALQRSGRFALETLPPSGTISYGNPANPQDLSGYQVFVVDEPNVLFTEAESLAIVRFVQGGGGLFMVADHGGADRNNDGFDAVMIWNQLGISRGDPFGITFVGDSFYDVPSKNVLADGSNPLLHGVNGQVRAVGTYAGSSMILSAADNPSVRGVVWRTGKPQGSSQVIVATATFGSGRVVAMGDSSPMDDGTGPGTLHNGWSDPVANNGTLVLNATYWLAKLP